MLIKKSIPQLHVVEIYAISHEHRRNLGGVEHSTTFTEIFVLCTCTRTAKKYSPHLQYAPITLL